MDKIGKYAILQQIEETRGSKIYRAKKEGAKETVIIKTLKLEYPSPADLARFRQEYSLIKKLSIEGVVQYLDLIDYRHGLALVLEDFNGTSLKKFLQLGKFTVENFLPLAARMSKIFGELHSLNIVHKDIKPNNILFEEKRKILKVTDFGISQELTKEASDIYNPAVIEGTLAYMSPEQTGRMNRSVDYRTDLYSLGVAFYEMLTGKVPFSFTDPMELIHAHIALTPPAPHLVDPQIPEILSSIIMKLLSKTAESRYQNCFGLAADLEECERQYAKKKQIGRFNLAQRDISLKFSIPQLLIGRESELQTLMDSFERVSEGEKEIVLVDGHPGIGKSALIHEIHKPILAQKGYFLSGKYDQFRRDVPYSSIIQAFLALTRQILSESEERIAKWKTELEEALGSNARVITDVIPDVSLILRETPEIPELGPEEAQNRFNFVFKSFVKVFAQEEHPIVLFLDDVQWADSSSIRLLGALMSDSYLKHILIVAAFRDNEIDSSHPFLVTMKSLEEKTVPLGRISLAPLTVENVNALISNFLRTPQADSLDLSEIIHKKTGGNPFFVNQFLKSMYEEKLLVLDPRAGWQWDIDLVARRQVTENVVDLLAHKITRLPKATQDILKTCACIGNRFDLETLSIITNSSMESTLEKLTGAIDEGMVHRNGPMYHFHHDRIMEAAYSLIPEENRNQMHYTIGQYMLESTDEASLPKKVLYIVNQLNAGKECITTDKERLRLRELNILSAQKARRSAAYGSTYKYLKVALDYVDENTWNQNHTATLDLHISAAEAAYLSANFEDMERFSQSCLRHTRSPLEMAKVQTVRINTYIARHQMREAIDAGLKILEILGTKIPKKPKKWQAGLALLKAKQSYRGRAIEELADLPFIDDPIVIATQDVYATMGSLAYLVDVNLWSIVSSNSLRLSVVAGHTPVSCYSYAAMGSALCFLRDIDTGYQFGRVALKVAKKTVDRKYQQRTHFVYECYIGHWKNPLSSTIGPLQNAYQMSIEVGDLEFAGLSLMIRSVHLFLSGRNLIEVEKEIAGHAKSIAPLNHQAPHELCLLCYQAVLNLKGDSKDPADFQGEHFDEGKMKSLVLVPFFKLVCNYIMGRHGEARENAKKAKRRINAVRGMAYEPTLFLFEALAAAAEYNDSSNDEKKKIIKRLEKNRARLKSWADHSPGNCLHKYHLLEAELARLQGKTGPAIEHYEKAIGAARENGFTQEESIARELAGRLFLDQGKDDLAKMYLTASYYSYMRWGSVAKIGWMDKEYPDHIVKTSRLSLKAVHPSEVAAGHSVTMGMTSSSTLDVNSIFKAGQAIALEIESDRLLEKIIQMSIANAGAQKAYLMMEKHGEKGLFIEAEGVAGGEIKVLHSVPLKQFDLIPKSIVNYVRKTKQDLILHNAKYDDRFMNDPCIAKYETKSVLCAPIVYSGKIAGIIYLENNLSTNAFTRERLEVLQILNSQAAISIENQRLLAERENAARMEAELRIASKIQRSLVPRHPRIKDYEVTGFMLPADEVGGDYYDAISGKDVDWAIIGDVSGHGVPAGLIMMMVQTCTQFALREDPNISPALLLEKINAVVSHNIEMLNEKKYMTLNALAIHQGGKIVHAGLHQDILVYSKNKDEVHEVETYGMWVGLDETSGILNEDREFAVEIGDIILLYTDGITEATNEEGLMFGNDHLKEILRQNGKKSTLEIRDQIMDAIRKHTRDDDVSLLILKREH